MNRGEASSACAARKRYGSVYGRSPLASEVYSALTSDSDKDLVSRSAIPDAPARRRTASLPGARAAAGVAVVSMQHDSESLAQQPPFLDTSRRLPPPNPSTGYHQPTSPEAYASRTVGGPLLVPVRSAAPRWSPAITTTSALSNSDPRADTSNARTLSRRYSGSSTFTESLSKDAMGLYAPVEHRSAPQQTSSPAAGLPMTSRTAFLQRIHHRDVAHRALVDTSSAARSGRETPSHATSAVPDRRRPPAVHRQHFTLIQLEALEAEFMARGGYIDRRVVRQQTGRFGETDP